MVVDAGALVEVGLDEVGNYADVLGVRSVVGQGGEAIDDGCEG